jgi:5'-deoxynucleotidase YfbR-like HD superfamily hydrolase
MKAEILTCTGRMVPLTEWFEPDINEIAVSLSRLARFNGHTTLGYFPYSVAQHSVMVSHMVPQHLALAGLLHDSTEAYLGDFATPLKNLLPDYKFIEGQMARRFESFFECESFEHPEIKRADMVMLVTEWRDLMTNEGHPLVITSDLKPLEQVIVPVDAVHSYGMFMDRYRELADK